MSTRGIAKKRKELQKTLKEGIKLYERKEFFQALQICKQTINKYKLYQDFSDLVKEFEGYSNKILLQLDKKLQRKIGNFLKDMLTHQQNHDFQIVIKNCAEFLESIKKYVQISRFSERFRKVHDIKEDAIIKIWEPKYKELQTTLKDMLANNKKEKAIDLGMEFIEELKNDSKITGIRIFRQDIYLIIEPSIVKKYSTLYENTLTQIKQLQHKREYPSALKKAALFLKKIKKYENNKNIEILERRMKKRIEIIEVEKDNGKMRDLYDDVIIRVERARENNDYEGAIALLEDAKSDAEQKGGHSKIYNLFANDITNFKQEKVIIGYMKEIQTQADKLKGQGHHNTAMLISQKAQELHNAIPMIYKHRGSEAAETLHSVRHFMNNLDPAIENGSK